MRRPAITCHMIASLDGRLLTGRWPASEDTLHRLYEGAAQRLGADGWIVGRRTMQDFMPSAEPATGPACPGRADLIADRAGRPLAICFDRKGKLRPESGDLDGDHLVLVLSDEVSQAHAETLAARGVSVVFAGPGGNRIGDALIRIREAFGIGHLLLEGGGTLNGAFLAAGLIDETSTLVFPVLDGERGVTAIYDRAGTTEARALELVSHETLAEGTVWLRHRIRSPHSREEENLERTATEYHG